MRFSGERDHSFRKIHQGACDPEKIKYHDVEVKNNLERVLNVPGEQNSPYELRVTSPTF